MENQTELGSLQSVLFLQQRNWHPSPCQTTWTIAAKEGGSHSRRFCRDPSQVLPKVAQPLTTLWSSLVGPWRNTLRQISEVRLAPECSHLMVGRQERSFCVESTNWDVLAVDGINCERQMLPHWGKQFTLANNYECFSMFFHLFFPQCKSWW